MNSSKCPAQNRRASVISRNGSGSKLSSKHQAFVAEYLRTYNGAAAARNAGYSAKAAKEAASRLLTCANIQACIAAEISRRYLTADHVLARLSEIASADIADFISAEGKINWRALRGRGYLIKRLKINKVKSLIEIEMHSAVDALELLARHLGVVE